MKDQSQEKTLYRKYRPQTFEEVIGQDHVIDSLQNSIKNNSLAHAYLFFGTRGTGKTSIARIFAKELGTDDQDIYEIDAASHTGVDNIRDLREGVATMPFSSQYKIYIIDEVHMLSKAAFNALLKTLEEPPRHVIFILATTELHKVLDTIKSRCVVFNFNAPTKEHLVPFIAEIAKKEGHDLDDESMQLIAQHGAGSYRDTLSHLQKVFSIQNTDKGEIQQLFSGSPRELVEAFITTLVNADQKGMLQVLDDVKAKQVAPESFISSAVQHVQEIIYSRYAQNNKDTNIEDISGLTTKHLLDLINLRQNMESSPEPHTLLSWFVLKEIENSSGKM